MQRQHVTCRANAQVSGGPFRHEDVSKQETAKALISGISAAFAELYEEGNADQSSSEKGVLPHVNFAFDEDVFGLAYARMQKAMSKRTGSKDAQSQSAGGGATQCRRSCKGPGDTATERTAPHVELMPGGRLEAALQRLRDNDPGLTVLDLSNNGLDVAGVEALARALRDNTVLTRLSLGNNGLGADGAEALEGALCNNTVLTQLSLGGNGLGVAGAEALARALRENTRLTQLDLGNNDLGAASVKALAGALRHNTVLTQLDLRNNGLLRASAEALARALHDNIRLRRLDLGGNDLGDRGARALAEALRINTVLTQLDLGANAIGAWGADDLARALRENTRLTRLNLGFNGLGDEGGEALAMTLRTSTVLTRLDLECNGIKDLGAEALARALHDNTVLTVLDLGANVFGRLVSKLRASVQAEQELRASVQAEQELSAVANAALSSSLTDSRQQLARLRGIGVEGLGERKLKELQATLQEAQRRVSDVLLRPEAEQRVVQENNSFMCPIGHALMREPVMAADGHTYERTEIAKWIQQKGASATSPKTNQILENTRLIDNHQCKASIDEAIERAMRELRASTQNGDREGEGAAASGRKRRRSDGDGGGEGR